MKLTIQRPSLIVMMGIAGSGKSYFCDTHFAPDEIVSSDECRRLLWGSERYQGVNREAFELVHKMIDLRLSLGALTVADVTGLTHRQPYIDLARKNGVPVYLFVFSAPMNQILQQDEQRLRHVGPDVIAKQAVKFSEALHVIEREDWDDIFYLDRNNDYEIESRYPNEIDFPGPYLCVGDIHGCYEELCSLLEESNFLYSPEGNFYYNPTGRKVLFTGDICDRKEIGNVDCLLLIMSMVKNGQALCVCGNHDNRFLRYLYGNKVKRGNGLDKTIAEMDLRPDLDRAKIIEFLESLPPYIVLDGGRLVITHAGIEPHMIGNDNKKIRDFCMYGERIGEHPETGLIMRRDWAVDYSGKPFVVYGHQVIEEAIIRNNTIDIDTGCVFGGKLTGFLWPEKSIVQ